MLEIPGHRLPNGARRMARGAACDSNRPRRPHTVPAAIVFGLLVALLPLTAAAAHPGDPDVDRVRVRLFPIDLAVALTDLESTGADVAAKDSAAGWIDVITTRDRVSDLGALGKAAIIDVSRPFREIARERSEAGGPQPAYKTYAEVTEELFAAEAAFPEIAKVYDLTEDFGAPPTWEGRHLLALKISDHVELTEAEPAILFDSLHHARELNTIEVALDIITSLTASYGNRPRATTLVDSFEIWVVPVVNPDGLEYVWSDEQFWRKNRRDNGDGTFGVDLNRNYPFLWGECGNNSSSPSSDVYRGPSPASEPEVQALIALADAIRPVVANSYHSSGREVLPPYVCADLAEAQVVDALREIYRDAMDYDWRLASSSGESFEWMYNQTSSVAFLTEISTAFQPPFDETLEELDRLRPGWVTLLEMLLSGPLVTGVVTDAATGAPLQAEIRADSISFTEGERRASRPENGFYGWLLPPGEHELTFMADGYDSQTITVESVLGGAVVDIALAPALGTR